MDTDVLAARLAPKLATLIHPGDADTPPFPLSLPTFQMASLPEGLAEETAEEMGLPTPDLNRHFLEAVFALVQAEGVSLIDTTRLHDLEAASAVQEVKRHQKISIHCSACGVKVATLVVRDFDTVNPTMTPEQLKVLGSLGDCSTRHKAAP